jgi:hypothetical protein
MSVSVSVSASDAALYKLLQSHPNVPPEIQQWMSTHAASAAAVVAAVPPPAAVAAAVPLSPLCVLLSPSSPEYLSNPLLSSMSSITVSAYLHSPAFTVDELLSSGDSRVYCSVLLANSVKACRNSMCFVWNRKVFDKYPTRRVCTRKRSSPNFRQCVSSLKSISTLLSW